MVDCLLVVVGHLQEVCADGVEAVVADEALVELVRSASPAWGPSAIAASTRSERSVTFTQPVSAEAVMSPCATRAPVATKGTLGVQRIGLLGRRTTEHVAGKSGGLADA